MANPNSVEAICAQFAEQISATMAAIIKEFSAINTTTKSQPSIPPVARLEGTRFDPGPRRHQLQSHQADQQWRSKINCPGYFDGVPTVLQNQIQFSSSLHEDPGIQFSKLVQTTSVAGYEVQFQSLATRIHGLSESFLMSRFINGLKDEIQCEVYTARPYDLHHAISLAKLCERKLLDAEKTQISEKHATPLNILDNAYYVFDEISRRDEWSKKVLICGYNEDEDCLCEAIDSLNSVYYDENDDQGGAMLDCEEEEINQLPLQNLLIDPVVENDGNKEGCVYIVTNQYPPKYHDSGGFPVWLKYVPGISFRTDNDPFKTAMKGFTAKIVTLLKSENMYESQGGPIILSQIENESEAQGKKLGAAGPEYMTWATKLAVGMDTGVPWVMCKEENAPDPVINTCNGFYCDAFFPNRPYKPTIWTEAWNGWFTEFGGPIHQGPIQDLAFAVARFIQKGGSFFNYYMYHGGTNFGRSAGGPLITTSYDYDAPLDEYGLIRAIKLSEKALVAADPTVTSLGSLQQAHVFSSEAGDCATFLSNYDTKFAARVMFNNMHYNLPPWSISILSDCKNVLFNTAKVGVQTSQMEMLPSNVDMDSWETYTKDLSSLDDSSTFTIVGLLEQINVTPDSSDYLWYLTIVDIGLSESFLHSGELPTLIVQSTGSHRDKVLCVDWWIEDLSVLQIDLYQRVMTAMKCPEEQACADVNSSCYFKYFPP